MCLQCLAGSALVEHQLALAHDAHTSSMRSTKLYADARCSGSSGGHASVQQGSVHTGVKRGFELRDLQRLVQG